MSPSPNLLLLFVATLLAQGVQAAAPDTLLTVAEASGFQATSRYADVVSFLERVAEHPAIHLTSFGESEEGRALPLAVWGAPDPTPEAARGTRKLRVMVLANIHAGEVAGKEAALMLLRELVAGRHAAWADSLVLLVAPIYNADGNERIDPRNRPLQHGPVDGMGTRGNANGLDLNRDTDKLDTVESRALVRALDAYDPHIFLDLHTTNGTVHAYHLTYAPGLHPNTSVQMDLFVRGEWLPAAQRMVRERTGYETFYYGNDKPEWGSPPGWSTFDPRPRFTTNYVALRNRFAILSEAYSYATFEERIRATLAFVTATLDFAHDRAGEVAAHVERADARSVVGERMAARAAGNWQASCTPGVVLLGGVVEEPNPHTGEPMWRRTDARREVELPMYQRFAGFAPATVPAAYLVPASLTEVTERLALHGIRMEPVQALPASVEAFVVDSVRVAERAFQDRYEQEVFGRYEPATLPLDPTPYLAVPMDQPLARLAFVLLEPRSDSGFAGWGIVRAEPGVAYPVLRIPPPGRVEAP